jgi:hypothetical protein
MLRAAVFTLLAASTLTGLCKRSEQAGHFMAMLLDCLFAQVLSGSAVFQRDSFRSAASQTDSFQEADSSQTVSTFATAILGVFVSHIFPRTTSRFGTSNPMLRP